MYFYTNVSALVWFFINFLLIDKSLVCLIPHQHQGHPHKNTGHLETHGHSHQRHGHLLQRHDQLPKTHGNS